MTRLAETILRARYGSAYHLGGPVSRTVRAVAGPGGPWLLKVHDEHVLPWRVALGRIYAAVAAEGLCPPILPDIDGQLLGLHESTVHSLHKHIGATPQTPTPEELAEGLAAMHACLATHCGEVRISNHFTMDTAALTARGHGLGLSSMGGIMAEIDRRLATAPWCVVHGDVHPSNVLHDGKRLFFVDFDSATRLPAEAEAAFVAWRCFEDAAGRDAFLRAYNRHAGTSLNDRDLARWLVFHCMQRIDFILAASERGDGRWLYDLEAQTARAREAVAAWEGA